jgi:hypothetical protein
MGTILQGFIPFFSLILSQQALFSHSEPALHVLWKSNIPRYLLWEHALPVLPAMASSISMILINIKF